MDATHILIIPYITKSIKLGAGIFLNINENHTRYLDGQTYRLIPKEVCDELEYIELTPERRNHSFYRSLIGDQETIGKYINELQAKRDIIIPMKEIIGLKSYYHDKTHTRTEIVVEKILTREDFDNLFEFAKPLESKDIRFIHNMSRFVFDSKVNGRYFNIWGDVEFDGLEEVIEELKLKYKVDTSDKIIEVL